VLDPRSARRAHRDPVVKIWFGSEVRFFHYEIKK
jgi:hypothetical protein